MQNVMPDPMLRMSSLTHNYSNQQPRLVKCDEDHNILPKQKLRKVIDFRLNLHYALLKAEIILYKGCIAYKKMR